MQSPTSGAAGTVGALSQPRARLAREDTDIDELYRQLDAHVEMEAAVAELARLEVQQQPPSVRLRHATTDARFDTGVKGMKDGGELLRPPVSIPRAEHSVDAGLLHLSEYTQRENGGIGTALLPAPVGNMQMQGLKEGGTRFDSHNILRSEETTDLVNLPEEQIWQKRDETAALQESADALDTPLATGSGLNMTSTPTSSRPAVSRHSVDRERDRLADRHSDAPPAPASARSRPAIPTSQSEHYDLQQRTLPTSGTGLTHLLSPGDVDDYQYARHPGAADTSSIRSSERSKATQKSSKSLTRRLSSFFTRSFRRKRTSVGTPTTPGSDSKRVSYSASAASYDERPASAATRLSLEDSEYIAQRSQQLLRLGFSLDIEEALAKEPDTFVFVPLTDSGYFSSDFEDLEKLPEVPLTDADSDEICALPESPQRPTPPPRHTNPASQRNRPTALRTKSAGNRLSDGHSPVTHPLMRQTDMGTGSPMGSPISYDGASAPASGSQSRREAPGRRLSFIEGTSVMESINHLAYPSQLVMEEDDGLPPVGRRAKEKPRFKRHPWKWIKSKF